MKKLIAILCLMCIVLGAAYAGGSGDDKSKPLTFVWLPNESGDDNKSAREAIGKLIEEAIGRRVVHKLTTDYAIAVEAIANKQAHLGFFGPQSYVEANQKNKMVQPLVVNSGASGTLSDAVYYSWLAVKLGNEGMYKSGSDFAIDNIQGKKFSWVSTSSTSGFKVPSSGIVSYFSKKPEWSKLTASDLLEGGSGKFFSEVLFGNSHQGAAVNLLTGKADIASFCDVCVINYIRQVSGTMNHPGSVYEIKPGAADPFGDLIGQQFVVIKSSPVLNSPMVVNTELLNKEEVEKIVAAFTAESTAKNEFIFIPKGATQTGLFAAGQKFLAVDDAWFEPIRLLSK